MSAPQPAPLIGLPTQQITSSGGPDQFGVNQAYVRALDRAGAVAVLIPLLEDTDRLRALYSRLDGILFPGGKDVAPREYGEAPIDEECQVDLLRDRVELQLARWAAEDGLPTLGICRGQQLINVARGGSLFQDLQVQGATAVDHAWHDGRPRDSLVHSVRLDPGSRLAQLLDETAVEVNSMHHQAVKAPGSGLRPVGHAPDGVIEAIESHDGRFLVAVQWHPEELPHLPWVPRLFQAFVTAAAGSA